MMDERVNDTHIIFLRSGPVVLSKVRYDDWMVIQNEYEDYMTSLGPWSLESIVSYFEEEFKDERNWPFSREAIKSFILSEENIVASDNGLAQLKNPSAVALRFNLMINARDLDGLSKLMTEDYVFIDSSDDVHDAGKKEMVDGWKEFFEKYPDYRNIFTRVSVKDDTVFIIGHSKCSEQILNGPALWTAKIRDGLVSEWRVYLDTPENRTLLYLPQLENTNS